MVIHISYPGLRRLHLDAKRLRAAHNTELLSQNKTMQEKKEMIQSLRT